MLSCINSDSFFTHLFIFLGKNVQSSIPCPAWSSLVASIWQTAEFPADPLVVLRLQGLPYELLWNVWSPATFAFVALAFTSSLAL